MHFGVAAAKQALADSGFELTDENRTEVGVVFGSGAGGQQLMIDNYVSLHDTRPADRRPDVHRQRPRRQLLGDDRHRDGGHRPQRVHGVGLRDRHAQRRRGRRGDPPRRLHRGHQRLDRGAAARGRARRVLEHARDGSAAPRRGAADRLAPVRRDPRRVRARRGRRLAVPRGPRARQGARRARSTPRSSATARPPTAGTWSSRSMPGSARPGRCRWRSSGAACRPTRSTSSTRTARRRRSATSARRRRSGRRSGSRASRDAKSIAISATKSMTGHMMGAAGAFEAFATVMSVAEQCAPGHAQLPRLRPGVRPVGPGRDRPDADPLRAVEQHRAWRPQRRGHLQAVRRGLTGPTGSCGRTRYNRA